MSENYLIKLRPLEPFFFGGEYTFGKDDSRNKEEGSRYFAKSELFPQQSALLGMFRKAILNKKNILTLHKKGEWVDSGKKEFESKNENYKEAIRLIGKGRFSYESGFDLGDIIEDISPIFISKDDKNYFVEAKDSSFIPRQSQNKMIVKAKEQNIIYFDGYDAKKSPTPKFRSKTDIIKLGDIYKSIQTVGIKKTQKGKTEDDSLFLKESYYFRNKETFAFVVESSEDMLFLDKTLVALGSDQSSFMLEVTDKNDSFEELTKDIFPSKKEFDRVVLLSETLLTQEAYELCEFIMGERKTMRHLIRNSNKRERKRHKSKRYYLFQRGTVIYTDNLDKLQKKLDITHLQKIGINKYTIAKGEVHA